MGAKYPLPVKGGIVRSNSKRCLKIFCKSKNLSEKWIKEDPITGEYFIRLRNSGKG